MQNKLESVDVENIMLKNICPKRSLEEFPYHNGDVNRGAPVAKRTIHIWTDEENLKILEYLKETIRNGHVVEKPTARVYYERMMREQHLKNCNHTLLYNKVRNFHTKYKAALKWQDEIGQGIKEKEGEEVFQEKLKARFPYFEYFEEIWGASEDKYSPSTSIVHHLRLPGTSKEDSSISGTSSVIKQEAADTESVIDSMPLEFNFEENSAFDGAMPEVESDPLSEHETAETSSNLVSNIKKRIVPHQRLRPDSTTAKRQNIGRTGYLEAAKLREEGIQARLKFQKEQLEFEKSKAEAELQLAHERFEFEKSLKEREFLLKEMEVEYTYEIQKKELEVRHLEITTDRELRSKELEIQSLKWKAELAKVQNNKI